MRMLLQRRSRRGRKVFSSGTTAFGRLELAMACVVRVCVSVLGGLLSFCPRRQEIHTGMLSINNTDTDPKR
jgi:hypothetical protein